MPRQPKPTDEELEIRFLYHPADDPYVKAAHVAISSLTLELAKQIRDIVPSGRGLACALTDLEKVRMWANQGIATDHDGVVSDRVARLAVEEYLP